MALDTGPAAGRVGGPHVIVCGNEKGGSGKSTLAVHLAVALIKSGYRVATIDLDGRQRSMSRYLENRAAWRDRTSTALAIPDHFHVAPSALRDPGNAEGDEITRFTDGIAAFGSRHHYIVIDTPGANTFLNRLAHRIADTLVTPVNDSFVDLDVIGDFDARSNEIRGPSHYAAAVTIARRERAALDGRTLDWVVVRNRLGSFSTRNERRVDGFLRRLAGELDFRLADGISERVIYRELFPFGATVIDELDQSVIGVRPTLSHLAARQEMRRLVSTLNLPTDELGRRRAALQRRYAEGAMTPIEMPDIFVT